MKNIERKLEITGFCSSFDFEWNPEFTFHGESHEMWEIVYVSGGSVEVTENEKVYLLEKNNIIIHAPWEFHCIRSAKKSCPTGHVMSFFAKGEFPNKLRKGIFILNAEQALQYASICERATAFLEFDDSPAYAGQEIADSLAVFLIKLSGENVHASADTSPAATEYRKIVIAMSNGVCENKTLYDFACECGDSISYIKQLFGKYAGASPKTCYNKLRVRYAAKLLDEGVAVRDIAEKMNFSSSNYFSSFFKKYTGLSPIDYKHRDEEVSF